MSVNRMWKFERDTLMQILIKRLGVAILNWLWYFLTLVLYMYLQTYTVLDTRTCIASEC